MKKTSSVSSWSRIPCSVAEPKSHSNGPEPQAPILHFNHNGFASESALLVSVTNLRHHDERLRKIRTCFPPLRGTGCARAIEGNSIARTIPDIFIFVPPVQTSHRGSGAFG